MKFNVKILNLLQTGMFASAILIAQKTDPVIVDIDRLKAAIG
jgi:hypothetical protein